ncbi:MAG: outer membrane protein assembly factor BamB family protein [Planctomycetota bacterium]
MLAATCVVGAAFGASVQAADQQDWPWWRGPNHNGIAAPGQNPPQKWDETTNVLWKTPIPGRGHGTPIVVGDRIYLPTADETHQSQSVFCLDRATGRVVWQTEVHRGHFNEERQKRATWASSSVSHDGERLFVNFFNRDAIYTYALSLDGRVLWETKISDFVSHQGFGSSPLIYRSLVIVTADTKVPGGGAIAALDRQSGSVVWKNPRPQNPNYTSPVVFDIDGKEQLIVTGNDLLSSFDPMTGETFWEFEGATTECVVTAVTDGQRIFTGGGYPKNHAMAMRADGSGKVDWINNQRIYVPSMIAKDGHLYAVADAGFAICWDSATGKELWKKRLGAEFFASPTMVGDVVYASNVRGATYVFKATPSEFELISVDQLGDEAYASPVICGDRIYLRVAVSDDTRQEYLYCIGE